MLALQDLLSTQQPFAEDSGAEGSEHKAKKSRKRAQVSCSECHKRKQKCDRGQPCERCVKVSQLVLRPAEPWAEPRANRQRGNPEGCVVMPSGEQVSASRLSPPAAAAAARKRKQSEAESGDLAERVRQLEAIVKNAANGAGSVTQYSPPINQSNHSPSLRADQSTQSPSFGPALDVKSENSVTEQEAVAALSTLAKAIPKEGGTEARIYSGPGSVATILEASGFSASSLSKPPLDGRARVSDYQLYSGAGGIAGMVNSHPRLTKLADALSEQKAKLPPPVMAHYLFNFFHNCHIFSDKFVTFPRGAYQAAYDALFEPQHQDQSQEAQAARALNWPKLASEHSLAFISQVFAIFALCEIALNTTSELTLKPSDSTRTLARSQRRIPNLVDSNVRELTLSFHGQRETRAAVNRYLNLL